MPNQERLVPLLVVRDGFAAIDFYVRAFAAREIVRYLNRINDTLSHAELAIDDVRFALTEELRAFNADAPPSLGGSAVVLQLAVDDCASALVRATAAGAAVVFPVQEFCGERMARLRDPFGHLWILREPSETLSPTENQARRDALFESLARAQRAKPTSPTRAPLSTIAFESARTLAGRVRTRELSAVELTQSFIDRIERLDGAINAVVVRDFDRALAAAKEADQRLARGGATGPLHGVPFTVKEAFDVAGLATTWGVPALAQNIATRDADVVARLRSAGGILLGKTNVPVMLSDFQADNPLFGSTKNPWDPTRTPGGSSGGCAAALAAGFTALEVGSDVGGSIRNPAHYCGVYGHKPSAGLVSLRGHAIPGAPTSPDMAVAGPLGRSADDLALALDLFLGREGSRLELPPPRRTSLEGLRVALWATEALAPVDDEIATQVTALGERLAALGATVSDRARPAFDPAAYRRTYVALVTPLMGASASDEMHEANRARAAALDPNDDSKMAAFARALVLDHRGWLAHDRERARLRDVWRAFFEDWDVLVCPIMASVAFPVDPRPPLERTIVVNGAPQPYFDQVFWASLATLAYLPATAFPSGRSSGGLPIGLQAIGRDYGDRTTIDFARLVSGAFGGFEPPPEMKPVI